MFATIKQLLEAQQADVGRLQFASSARQRRIIREAFERVKADIAALSVGGQSWSHADRMVVHAMIGDAYRQIREQGEAVFIEDLKRGTFLGQRATSRYLATLDKAHTGVVRPLRFDTLRWWTETHKEIGFVRLRQFQRSFERYGAATIIEIEDSIARATIAGKTWEDARDEVWRSTRNVVNGNQYMVDRIIRTEMSAAYNGTTLEALHAEDTPEDPMQKRLVTTFDSRTGKDSIALHGQTRKVREPFFDAMLGILYMAPPNRPNDRETVVGWRSSYGRYLADPLADDTPMEVIQPAQRG